MPPSGVGPNLERLKNEFEVSESELESLLVSRRVPLLIMWAMLHFRALFLFWKAPFGTLSPICRIISLGTLSPKQAVVSWEQRGGGGLDKGQFYAERSAIGADFLKFIVVCVHHFHSKRIKYIIWLRLSESGAQVLSDFSYEWCWQNRLGFN